MKLDTYRKLFVHRADVFAVQHPDGHYEPVRRPLDDMDLEEHLGGIASYGVYVIDPQRQVTDAEAIRRGLPKDELGLNTVSYVVFDLDTYDEEALEFLTEEVAMLVMQTDHTNAEARKCLLLENSGGKGFHIWLFFSEPVPARDARLWAASVKDAYDTARREYPENTGGYGEWPDLEVFPKQDYVAEGGFGNLVKLPLGVHAKSGNRSEIVTNVGQGWAKDVSSCGRLSAALIPSAPADTRARSTERRATPFACISKLIEEGAPQGMRDKAMFHFAHYACGTGLPEDLVRDWCERVNEEFQPPLTDAEVDTKVRSAAGMAAPHPGCKADWLQGFCPGGENCFAPWNERNDKPRRERVAPMDDDDSYEAWERRQA